jgi:hypothetical protein
MSRRMRTTLVDSCVEMHLKAKCPDAPVKNKNAGPSMKGPAYHVHAFWVSALVLAAVLATLGRRSIA